MSAAQLAAGAKPRIDLDKPRYDQNTYLGRFRHMLTLTNPLTLLKTSKDLDEAIALLDAYKKGADVDEKRLWSAKQLRDSAVHPQTGERIVAPARMSAFMPANIVICYGLMLPQAGIATTVFWQWINQSYNLLVNHANRNASNPMSMSQIGGAYAAAVGASCAVAVGMSQAVKRGYFPAAVKPIVPYMAVSSAGMLNVFVMRWNEISEGVAIMDSQGRELGVSKEAGLLGVSMSAASRAVWSIPALVVPPVCMSLLRRNASFNAMRRLHVPAELLLISVSLLIGVPLAIALFKQTVEVPAARLEPKFHQLRDPSGEPIRTVFFNKGL